MSNPRCYYRTGVTLMVIGCALTVWGAFQMPRAVAAAVIALMLCAAGLPLALVLINARRAAHRQKEPDR